MTYQELRFFCLCVLPEEEPSITEEGLFFRGVNDDTRYADDILIKIRPDGKYRLSCRDPVPTPGIAPENLAAKDSGNRVWSVIGDFDDLDELTDTIYCI